MAVVVQPGSGDILQFLKAGIMEVPDVLVVTKADLGAPADRARRDLHQALGAVGPAACRCWPCRRSRRHGSGGAGRRARRAARAVGPGASGGCALAASPPCASCAAEHGERALRSLGGRREAERLLAGQDPSTGTAALVALLEEAIGRVKLARQIALLVAVSWSPPSWRSSPARPTSAWPWASPRSCSRSRSWRSDPRLSAQAQGRASNASAAARSSGVFTLRTIAAGSATCTGSSASTVRVSGASGGAAAQHVERRRGVQGESGLEYRRPRTPRQRAPCPRPGAASGRRPKSRTACRPRTRARVPRRSRARARCP